MVERQDLAYKLFAGMNLTPAPEDMGDLNREIYRVLCRETHARPRLDSFALKRDASGISVRIEPRDATKSKAVVVESTRLSVLETRTALLWRRQKN